MGLTTVIVTNIHPVTDTDTVYLIQPRGGESQIKSFLAISFRKARRVLTHPSQSGSRRSSPAPGQIRPGPYPFHNPTLHSQFDLFHPGSGTSTPITSGSEGDLDHDHEGGGADGEGEGEGEGEDGEPRRSGRAGNRRRQKYSRTRTGCLCCRTRRIKCDEARPVCKRCIIAKKTVSLFYHIVPAQSRPSGIRTMKDET